MRRRPPTSTLFPYTTLFRSETARASGFRRVLGFDMGGTSTDVSLSDGAPRETTEAIIDGCPIRVPMLDIHTVGADRKSTRLNSSHVEISYAVFCLKKKSRLT